LYRKSFVDIHLTVTADPARFLLSDSGSLVASKREGRDMVKRLVLKRLVFGAAIALLLGGMMVTTEAQGDTITFNVVLSPGEETPVPIASGAHGAGIVTVSRNTQMVTWNLAVYGLGTGLTDAHIHVGPPGAGGPTVVNIRPIPVGISGSFALIGSASLRDLTPRPANGVVDADTFALMMAAGVTYVNLHSQANPGGEIRGRLCAPANIYNGVQTC
jgi:hypothetical protein